MSAATDGSESSSFCGLLFSAVCNSWMAFCFSPFWAYAWPK